MEGAAPLYPRIRPNKAEVGAIARRASGLPFRISISVNLKEHSHEHTTSQQMQNDMVIRGMAARTQESYLSAVSGLTKYYRRPPDRIAVHEVQSYLLHLLQERGLSASTCNLAMNGVRFFYRITLGQSETQFYIPRPKQPQRLPRS